MGKQEGSSNSAGGAIATGLVALGSGIANLWDARQQRKYADRNTDKTIAHQKAESELKYQRDMEMWNAQNQYNSPAAQMERFKAAGLNPHLIYGQGNPGNAQSPAAYQPPSIQYRYEAGKQGAAIASVLPTLMAVGSWLTDMRAKEVGIQQTIQQTEKGAVDVEKARQLIAQLEQTNPEALRRLQNQNALFPYQQSMQSAQTERAWRINADLEQEYFNKWGSQVYAGNVNKDVGAKPGSAKAIERLHQLAKLEAQRYQNKLLDAKSSFTDFNVTDPQSLMQLVLGGVMNLTGTAVKMKHQKPKPAARPTPKRHVAPFHDR